MTGDAENGNGRKWLRKPQFSIEDIIKLAVFLGPWIMAGAVGILVIKDIFKDARAAKRTAESTYAVVEQLNRRADTLQTQVGRLATKRQVQSAINQGNAVHEDQYRRIIRLERRQGMKPSPAHSEVRVYRWPQYQPEGVAMHGPTEDLWIRDPDGGEAQP